MLKKQISKQKPPKNKQNFSYTDVKGDGNCLFRAISVCLYGDQKHHKALRLEACKQIANNVEFFQPQIYQQLIDKKISTLNREYQAKQNLPLLQQYKKIMLIDKVYGGQLELQAIAQSRNLKIVLYGLKASQSISLNDIGQKKIYLKFLKSDQHNDGHYMAMQKIRKTKKNKENQ